MEDEYGNFVPLKGEGLMSFCIPTHGSLTGPLASPTLQLAHLDRELQSRLGGNCASSRKIINI
jgi:hypothetical protein